MDTDSVCSVEGCERPVLVKTRRLCRRHYQRWQRHGDPEAGRGYVGAHDRCAVTGCEGTHEAKGLCSAHYMRLWRYADPEAGGPLLPVASLDERFWVRVDRSGPVPDHRSDLGPCWLWLGITTPGGYGQIRRGGRTWVTHRWVYELLIGPIPAGLDLDHLCRVRRCVRPSHLEPVTRGENLRRGYAARRAGHG